MQVKVPATAAKVPAGQIAHEGDAETAENVPVAHVVHVPAPRAEYDPAEQLLQDIEARGEYFPAAQLKQVDATVAPVATE